MIAIVTISLSGAITVTMVTAFLIFGKQLSRMESKLDALLNGGH